MSGENGILAEKTHRKVTSVQEKGLRCTNMGEISGWYTQWTPDVRSGDLKAERNKEQCAESEIFIKFPWIDGLQTG